MNHILMPQAINLQEKQKVVAAPRSAYFKQHMNTETNTVKYCTKENKYDNVSTLPS